MKKSSISLKSSLINPHNSSVAGHRSSSEAAKLQFFSEVFIGRKLEKEKWQKLFEKCDLVGPGRMLSRAGLGLGLGLDVTLKIHGFFPGKSPVNGGCSRKMFQEV